MVSISHDGDCDHQNFKELLDSALNKELGFLEQDGAINKGWTVSIE